MLSLLQKSYLKCRSQLMYRYLVNCYNLPKIGSFFTFFVVCGVLRGILNWNIVCCIYKSMQGIQITHQIAFDPSVTCLLIFWMAPSSRSHLIALIVTAQPDMRKVKKCPQPNLEEIKYLQNSVNSEDIRTKVNHMWTLFYQYESPL